MKKKLQNKTSRPTIVAILMLVTTLMASFFLYSANVLAKGNLTGASGNKAPSSTTCSGLTGRPTFCGQFGVSWRYYPLEEIKNIDNYREAWHTCNEEDTDGIYILAYEWVDGSGNIMDKQVLDRPDKNVHVEQVRPPYSTGGGYNYKFLGPSSFPSGKGENVKKWNEVQDLWRYYKDAFENDIPWKKTTWFCGDETKSQKPMQGVVMGDSGISVNGVDDEKTSALVGSTYKTEISANSEGGPKDKVFKVEISTSKPSISGQIWHNQYYNNVSEGWPDVKKKAKRYKGINLNVAWDVADGDVDAGEFGYAYEWKIPAKETSLEQNRIGKVNFTVNAGDEYCHTMTFEPVRFKFNNEDGVSDELGRAHTTACAIVRHVDKPEEATDEFWATSSVEVPNAEEQLGGYDPGKHTSEIDSAVGLKVGIDSDTLQFNFSHNMGFNIADANNNIWRYKGEHETCRCLQSCPCLIGPCGCCRRAKCYWYYRGTPTDLTYELYGDTENVTEDSKTEQDQYKAGIDRLTENQNEEVATYTYTITGIEPGETKKVCHKIKYTPKGLVIPVEEKLVWKDDHHIAPEWVYGTPTSSGTSEDSEACIEITRPDDPPEGCPEGECPDDDPTPYGPQNGGKNKTDVMYAGEKANVGWKVEAKSVPVRRVKDYSGVSFVVNDAYPNVDTENNPLRESGHVEEDPCSYFSGKAMLLPFTTDNPLEPTRTCAEFSGQEGLSVDEEEEGLTGIEIETVPNKDGAFTKELSIAIPDNVGAKYCVSYGYKWGYWWGVAKAETGDELTDEVTEWHYVDGKDYWTNYGSACRTIAKKPSMAIWNGSLFTSGGAISSTAPRHNDANQNQPSKLNNDATKTTFGSWTENILAAGGEVNKFASSGAYGIGLPGLVTGNKWDMAWQTIANTGLTDGTGKLGSSGINYNSSYSTRLSAYLKSNATNDASAQNATTYGGINGAAGTQILYFNPGGTNGTLTITGNITLDATAKSSIYELPQVVLYVDGSVKIKPEVTELDAWIIATGNVDTCDGWEELKTETKSVHRNNNTTCDKQLKINGPVIAGTVTLNRTYGADNLAYYTASSKNTPSEIFNLSALTYLWSFAQAGRYKSSYTDAYARELAPRY